MVKIRYQLWNEETLIKTFDKEFKSDKDSRDWERAQEGHPYLSITRIGSVKE